MGMTIEEMKQKIRKCDVNRPYLFISYSSADADYVFEDVIGFQKRGVNVWIDDRGIDNTLSSWKDSALKAVRDIDCRMVLFYVSRNSVMSPACLEELRETWSEETKELHGMQPVRFICVDVRTGNEDRKAAEASILDLIDECWKENAGNYGKEKKNVRSVRMKTASRFYKEIFNGTNERIRIPARKEGTDGARKYYTNLCSFFPDPVILLESVPLDMLRKLADEEDDAVAQHSLGLYFFHKAMAIRKGKTAGEAEPGEDTKAAVEEYLKKSFEYYSKSAEKGFAKAENKMGLCYRDGNGTDTDPKTAARKAFEWFGKAARQGDDMGQFNLGKCFESGTGTEKNMDMAIWWYNMAAAQGNSRSIYRLRELKKKDNSHEAQD